VAVFSNIWLDGLSYPIHLTIDVALPVGPDSNALYQVQALSKQGSKLFGGQGASIETAIEQLLVAYVQLKKQGIIGR